MNYRNRNAISMFIIIVLVIFLIPSSVMGEDAQVFVGGTIRNTGSGWYAISNSAHQPIGITSVETATTCVIVHYAAVSKVITFQCTVDETMASEGYTVGASVGLDQAWIYIYDKNHIRIDPSMYISTGGNIWIYGCFIK